jgi:hypothetical protein
MNKLRPGDRIRLLAPTLAGWMGEGTVTEVVGNEVRFEKDGPQGGELAAYAHRDEVERADGLWADCHKRATSEGSDVDAPSIRRPVA